MDVRIGVINSPRELEFQLPDDTDQAAVEKQVADAVEAGTGVVWFTDRKDRRIGVSAANIAYVAIGTGADKGKIGFGAI